MQIYKIIGPPGTGKTYRILQELEKASKKYSPERIGAVSFTNSAISEMKDRIVNTSHVSHDVLKNVRTIHSQCFRLLGLEKEQVAETHIDEFNKMYPKLSISCSKYDTDNETVMAEMNNSIFARMQISRNKCQVEKMTNQEKNMYRAWMAWMEEGGYVDYTGMLEQTLLFGRYPDIDVLFIDEAQDLTQLQMDLILKWAENVEITTIVGDADQAIFRFAGSDPDVFKNLDHKWIDVLKQSHRVPKKILNFSLKTIRQIKDREDVDYMPKKGDIEGTICQCNEPILSQPGSHMIITRCMYEILLHIKELKRRRILWCNPYRPEERIFNPMLGSEFKAVKSYWMLSQGREITDDEARDMTDHVIAKDNIIRGKKTEIVEKKRTKNLVSMFDILDWGFTDSFLKFEKPLTEIIKPKTESGKIAIDYAAHNKIEQEPVIVGTIHSVKGGEADNVWVSLKKTRKINQEILKNNKARDDEIRIAYVAFTRAKNFLGILR